MMDVKTYLRSIMYLDRRIDNKLEQAMRIRSQAERVTGALDPNRGSGRTARDASSSIDKLIDLEREINGMVGELVTQKRTVMEAIGRMTDPNQALVLELRYLNGKSWEAIAKEMGYDRVSVWRVHGRALENIRFRERCNTMQHSDVV
ncbi:MAG: RNA polymerase subunit sigma-24 [Clostridia bacterium]